MHERANDDRGNGTRAHIAMMTEGQKYNTPMESPGPVYHPQGGAGPSCNPRRKG